MTRSNEEIERICNQLLEGKIHYEALEVTFDEFQKFFMTFVNLTRTTPVISLVNIETIIVAQFSGISPQHFDITDGAKFSVEDFDFAIQKNWYGPKKRPQNFLFFLWQELRNNWWRLLPIFLLSVAILYLVNDINFNDLIGEFLIQSGTIFFSLYIIFTVSQSRNLWKDTSLFKDGILHKYYNDDKNITLLGILTIALTFLSIGISHLLSTINLTRLFYLELNRIFSAILLGLTITLLFNTFITVVHYYLERTRDINERDIISDLMHEDYKKWGMEKE